MEDLLQEIFLRTLRQQNGLCGIDNPRAWLFHTARNLLINRLPYIVFVKLLPPRPG